MAFDLTFEVDSRGLGTISNFTLRDQPIVRGFVARSVIEFEVTIYQQPTCFGLIPMYRLISPRGSVYPSMSGNRFGPVSAGQTYVTFIDNPDFNQGGIVRLWLAVDHLAGGIYGAWMTHRCEQDLPPVVWGYR